MSIPQFEEIIEPNDQTEARREHLEALRALVGNVYPNKFERSKLSGADDTITRVLRFEPVVAVADEMAAVKANLKEGERPPADVKDRLNERLRALGTVRIAGRLAVPPRVMGKAAFVHLSDGISKIQIYVRRDDVQGVYNGAEPPASAGGEDSTFESVDSMASAVPPAHAGGSASGWEVFQLLDHGDFIGVEGFLFVTNTGEVSVHVEKLQFLAKAMLPMPDKMHGIADPEIRQRQRYADLIASSLQVKSEPPASAGGQELTTREVFEIRAKVISSLRRYLEDHGYIEVETPMLTPKATGAAAKPFETHHNALDITLYARIAPELYLKRLVVGGFEKVYELNRNFRNEGISYKHNPEFTMLEFYCAYMDVNGMMDFCEQLLKETVQKAVGRLEVTYEGNEVDFGKFERITMKRAIAHYSPDWLKLLIRGEMDDWLDRGANLKALHDFLWWFHDVVWDTSISYGPEGESIVELSEEGRTRVVNEKWVELTGPSEDVHLSDAEVARYTAETFEDFIEERIINPTFIIDYPKSISPLSKASPEDPQIAERFELFINGMEVANGFSELNDPKEQYERFVDQMSERDRGDEEAMVLDEDYVRALSYGMPPAAGIGIGIDRLVMLLTNKHSIRDVILFPHLRPERRLADHESNE